MFGIGSTEFLVILLVALLVLGPKNLAKVTKTVGKYVGEFRRVSTDFQRTLNAEVAEEERQENREAVRRKAAEAKARRARQLEEQAAAETAAKTGAALDAQARLAAEQAAAEDAETAASGPAQAKGGKA
ncbi:MAG: Sec-independent protein translocase protein TatB [Desulfovibrionaceae bacterium]|nr:Sec-independent protein translocase protein TatB [Desulfovibrionaceae bacterium]